MNNYQDDLIGMFLVKPQLLDLTILKPSYFDKKHRDIFTAIKKSYKENKTIILEDILAVKEIDVDLVIACSTSTATTALFEQYQDYAVKEYKKKALLATAKKLQNDEITIDEFYKQLSNVYETGSPEAVELYLNDRLKEASHGCDMCFEPMEITVSNELGSFYRGMGQFDKSAEFFEIAKRLVFVHIGDKTVQYATVLNNLAGTYRLAGKYEEAADLFNESALIYSTTIGKDNSYYCSILNNLALVYQDMKEYGKAEEMLTDALKSSRTLENSAMDVAITYSNLGALYLEMGDYTRAEEDLRESVDIYEQLDTNHQVHLASVYNSLGILYYKQSKLEEAKEAYQQALKLTLYHYGKNHEYEILCRNIAAIEEAVRNA